MMTKSRQDDRQNLFHIYGHVSVSSTPCSDLYRFNYSTAKRPPLGLTQSCLISEILNTLRFKYTVYAFFFSVQLLSVLRDHSVFSSPPQQPMTSNFEGFLEQILSITLFSHLNF